MDLTGRTALVTGGARRVGRATILALAEAGANVVINYNSAVDTAEEVAAEARAFGVEVLTAQADVSEYDQVEKMAQKALSKFGCVDILVNNASRFKPSPFPTDDIASWKKTTGILIDGPFYCTNLFAPGMLDKGYGVIINIVDLSIYESWPRFGAHVVGKSALLAFTRQMALELGPTVRSNAIAPGPVLPPPDYSPEKIQRTASKTLLNRWGSPKDVTRTVLFLIESDYITGEVIVVDAGERYGHRKNEEG